MSAFRLGLCLAGAAVDVGQDVALHVACIVGTTLLHEARLASRQVLIVQHSASCTWPSSSHFPLIGRDTNRGLWLA